MTQQAAYTGTGRLTEAEFDQQFGKRVSQAIAFDDNGRCVVNSALTRRKYVAWNWQTGSYDVEPRRQS
jgi:hypothetical protein